jgi:enterobactin synthetase component D
LNDILTPVVPPDLLQDAVVAVAVHFDVALAGAAGGFDLALPVALKRAVPRRQAEFLAGRYAAREALGALGCSGRETLAVRPDRSPAWPPHVVGSITHTDAFAWAAVARKADRRGIGIDSETIPSLATAREIRPVVSLPADTAPLRAGIEPRWGEAAGVCFALSVRESVYKCIAPELATEADFSDVHICGIDSERGTFRVRLARTLGGELPVGHGWSGRFLVAPPRVYTALEWLW